VSVWTDMSGAEGAGLASVLGELRRWVRRLWMKGRVSASTKSTNIATMTRKLANEMRMNPQWM